MTIQIAPALAALIHELEQLPGLGPLSAQRVAYWLLKDSESRITPLEAALADARQNIGRCPHCNSFTIKGSYAPFVGMSNAIIPSCVWWKVRLTSKH